jgi:hypothetical protein
MVKGPSVKIRPPAASSPERLETELLQRH